MADKEALGEQNPVYGPFFGVMGAAAAIIFSCKYNPHSKRDFLTAFAATKISIYDRTALLTLFVNLTDSQPLYSEFV